MFTVNDAYKAIEDREEFVVKKYDGLIVFDYIVILTDSFSGEHSDVRRNLRGVTFHEATGNMISLPLHKFFNIGQVEETQFNLLKNKNATIYEKADGSLVHFFIHPDTQQLLASTCRSALTPQAQEALSLAINDASLKDLILETIQNNMTPIFEFVSPTNQIVVQYSKPELIYLISRDRKDGSYHFEEKFPVKVQKFYFSFADIQSQLDMENFEGYVCHLDDGMFVKAKTPWYLERHRAVDALMGPKWKLFQIVFDGVMDDLIAVAVENFKQPLRQIQDEAQQDLLQFKKAILLKYEDVYSKTLLDVSKISNNFLEFEKETVAKVDNLVQNGHKIEALKYLRDLFKISLSEAQKFLQTKEFSLLVQKVEEPQRQFKKIFVENTGKMYPDDFHLIMSVYAGEEDDALKQQLMEVYKQKYPEKLYGEFYQ